MLRLLGIMMLALGVVGCANRLPAPTAGQQRQAPVELADVPFHPQEEYQCGPAALATVLNWAGVGVHPDELTASLYIPARRGTLQTELLAQARRYGRLAYRIPPEPNALIAELAAGHPVLVLQNLGLSWLPFWHYAVVVGYSPGDETFILRSGTHQRHLTPARTFLRTWARSSNWAMVVTAPGTVPASAVPGEYLAAAYELERGGQLDAAARAYAAGTARWPQDPSLALALGNAHYHQGDLEGAAAAFRRGIDAGAPPALLYNNLAHVLAELGRLDEAESAARAGLAHAGTDTGHLQRTLARIRCQRQPGCIR